MVQTRSESHGLRQFNRLKEAMDHTEEDPTVWKVTIKLPTGEMLRMIRQDNEWVYSPII